MGQLRKPPLVTPFTAMLAGDAAYFAAAKPLLEELLGPIALESPLYPFDSTTYYAATMGPNLQRKFFVFERLADAGSLPAWKLATNALEAQLCEHLRAAALPLSPSPSREGVGGGAERDIPARPINLDAGYLTGAKLVLASTKDFAHRLYLRDGIFAEITLSFRGDAWASHQFTFPDFKSGIYDGFLRQARDQHLRQIKHF